MALGRVLFLLPTTVVAFALATSCSHKGESDRREQIVDTHAAETAIRSASDDWGKAMTARDVDKTVSFYADDGFYFPNRHAIINSRDGLRAYWARLLSLPGPGLTCDTTRVEVAHSGELAYETGTCELTTKDLKGKSTTEKQKYVVIWKKQGDGSWKAVVDIDNTD